MPGTIVTDDDRCKGCSLCVEYCPVKVLRLADRINVMGYHPVELHEVEKTCTGCGACALMCPDMVITVYRTKKKKAEPVA